MPLRLTRSMDVPTSRWVFAIDTINEAGMTGVDPALFHIYRVLFSVSNAFPWCTRR